MKGNLALPLIVTIGLAVGVAAITVRSDTEPAPIMHLHPRLECREAAPPTTDAGEDTHFAEAGVERATRTYPALL